MIALHQIWKPESMNSFNSNFFLWAEASCSEDRKIIRGRARSSFPKRHPYQCKTEQLKKLLSSILRGVSKVRGLDLEDMKVQTTNIFLPTVGNVPLPSADFFLDQETYYELDFEEEGEIRPWEVEGVEVPFTQLIDLFLSDEDISSEEVSFGDDWFFLKKLSQFGLELLSRQRFIPAVFINNREEIESRWRVFPEAQRDYERFEQLARSLPTALIGGYPGISAGNAFKQADCLALIEHFLSTQIDSMMRNTLIEDNWSQNINPEDEFSQWLYSLGTAKADLEITDRQKDRLINSYTNWVAVYESFTKAHPLKSGIQIIPPGEPDLFRPDNGDQWLLQFFVKATGQEGFRLSTEEVKDLDKKKKDIILKRFGSPEQTLLRDLGVAAELFSPIKRGFESGSAAGIPSKADLTHDEAYLFLKESFWLLREAGFFLEIPQWWNEKTNTSKNELSVKTRISDPGKSPSKVSFWDTIVSFDWEIAVRDSSLSRTEFFQLAELKLPLVKIRGEWIELDQEKINNTMKYLRGLDGRELTVREIIQKGILAESSSDLLSLTGFDFSSWLKDFIKTKIGFPADKIEAPVTFRGKLRPYQLEGLNWLWLIKEIGAGGCLADDMGLGKTIQFIALILHDKKLNKNLNPYLLVCPTSVVENWAREIDKFAPSLSYFIHHGVDRKINTARDIILTTFGIMRRDIDLLKSIYWRSVCLDESQNIKNPNTKTAKAARSIPADSHFGLTGTPVENHLMELWSIMEFLNPGLLGKQKAFKQNFMTPIQEEGSPEKEKLLRSLINPFLLRRKKSDPDILPDLPDKIEKKEYIPISEEQATLYQAVVDESVKLLEEAEGIEKKGLILATITKLKQICNHPAQFLKDGNFIKERSGKLVRLTEMLDELFEAGEASLIFTQYVELGRMLKSFIQRTFHKQVPFLHGAVSRKARMRMVDEFQNGDSGNPVFILSLKAGGTGLNLTRASHVFHYDRWWNPAVEAQATDRTHRIGQKKNVQVFSFISTGTYEEKIDEMLEAKRDLADRIIRSGEKGLTELSTEEIIDLISYRKERF